MGETIEPRPWWLRALVACGCVVVGALASLSIAVDQLGQVRFARLAGGVAPALALVAAALVLVEARLRRRGASRALAWLHRTLRWRLVTQLVLPVEFIVGLFALSAASSLRRLLPWGAPTEDPFASPSTTTLFLATLVAATFHFALALGVAAAWRGVAAFVVLVAASGESGGGPTSVPRDGREA